MNETMLPMRTKSTRNHIKDTFLVMLKKKPFLKIDVYPKNWTHIN